jgi:chromosome segregation ATPase
MPRRRRGGNTDAASEHLAAVERRVSELKTENAALVATFELYTTALAGLKDEITDVRRKLADVKHEVADVKHEVADVKHEVADVKHEVADVKHEVADVKHEVADVKHDASRKYSRVVDVLVQLLETVDKLRAALTGPPQ